jgi:hypothetical protein
MVAAEWMIMRSREERILSFVDELVKGLKFVRKSCFDVDTFLFLLRELLLRRINSAPHPFVSCRRHKKRIVFAGTYVRNIYRYSTLLRSMYKSDGLTGGTS